MSRKMLRVLAVLALVTLTATGSAHAAGRTLSRGETSVLAAAWQGIMGWFHDLPGLMDPNGLKTDEGSSMDPNGGTKTQARGPLDPRGSTTDEGPAMDPNGLK